MQGRPARNSAVVKGLVLALALLARAAGAPDWPAMPPAEFARRPEVLARIEPASLDRDLLAAAILHETNRVRQRLGLPRFVHVSKLDEAADLKAAGGAVQLDLRHENPLPLTATPAERVRYTGLAYREVSENIARLALLDLPAGSTQVGVRPREGRAEYFRLDTGATVVNSTYARFAAMVVEAWMNSPPHRANIVNRDLTALGCAVRRCPSPNGQFEQVYAVQVFMRPP